MRKGIRLLQITMLLAAMAVLLAGCEAITALFDDPPVASGVAVSGSPLIGETLTGSYSLTDAQNDAEGASTYQWYRATDTSGTGVAAISGATATTYVLTDSDKGYFLCFEVTPIALTGEKNGTAVKSSYTTAAVISTAQRNDAYKAMYTAAVVTQMKALYGSLLTYAGCSLTTTATDTGTKYVMTFTSFLYNTTPSSLITYENTTDTDATFSGTVTLTVVGTLASATSISYVMDSLAFSNNDLGITSASGNMTGTPTTSGSTTTWTYSGTATVNGVERTAAELMTYVSALSSS